LSHARFDTASEFKKNYEWDADFHGFGGFSRMGQKDREGVDCEEPSSFSSASYSSFFSNRQKHRSGGLLTRGY
jgi:hypothetical protein